MACTIGLTLVVAIVAGLTALADAPLALFPAVLGAGAAGRGARCQRPGAAQSRSRWSCWAAWASPSPSSSTCAALAVALPLFLAAIDIVQAIGGGSTGLFTLSTSKPGDVLTLELPDWEPGSRPPG